MSDSLDAMRARAERAEAKCDRLGRTVERVNRYGAVYHEMRSLLMDLLAYDEDVHTSNCPECHNTDEEGHKDECPWSWIQSVGRLVTT
jgi:hypothetical protein